MAGKGNSVINASPSKDVFTVSANSPGSAHATMAGPTHCAIKVNTKTYKLLVVLAAKPYKTTQ